MPFLTLDALETRTPLGDADFPTKDGRVLKLSVSLSAVWQRRFSNLWAFVQRKTQILPTTVTRDVTTADQQAVILASGTITLTLPLTADPGDTYFFFNNGVGVITIAGTINGSAGGATLAAQYKYKQVTSLDGVNWIITANN